MIFCLLACSICRVRGLIPAVVDRYLDEWVVDPLLFCVLASGRTQLLPTCTTEKSFFAEKLYYSLPDNYCALRIEFCKEEFRAP